MSFGERPIGAAKGKQPNTEASCPPPPPLLPPSCPCRGGRISEPNSPLPPGGPHRCRRAWNARTDGHPSRGVANSPGQQRVSVSVPQPLHPFGQDARVVQSVCE